MPKGVYDRTAAVKRGAWKKAAKKRAKTMAEKLKGKISMATRAALRKEFGPARANTAKRTAGPKAVAKKSRRRA